MLVRPKKKKNHPIIWITIFSGAAERKRENLLGEKQPMC